MSEVVGIGSFIRRLLPRLNAIPPFRSSRGRAPDGHPFRPCVVEIEGEVFRKGLPQRALPAVIAAMRRHLRKPTSLVGIGRWPSAGQLVVIMPHFRFLGSSRDIAFGTPGVGQKTLVVQRPLEIVGAPDMGVVVS